MPAATIDPLSHPGGAMTNLSRGHVIEIVREGCVTRCNSEREPVALTAQVWPLTTIFT